MSPEAPAPGSKRTVRPLRRLRWVALSAALACVWPAAGQRVPVASYTERDGLPQSQVTGLTRDRDGFLWVATKNGGLARFDGTSFRLVPSAAGFSERVVGPLLLDAQGSLWVGGPALFVARGGRFHRVLPERVDALALGARGEVLAGGPGGVVRLLPGAREIRFSRLDREPALSLAADETRVWIGRPDGLSLLANGQIRRTSVPGLAVLSLVPDGEGGVVAGTENGLFVVDTPGTARSLGVPLPAPRVDALLVDGAERVWAGTPRGAVRLSRDLSSVDLSPADGLPAVRIVSLAAGASSEVWLGGDGAGLFRYAPSRFAVVASEAGLAETLPLSLAAAPDGTIWTSTARAELARLSGGRFEVFGAAQGLPRTDRFRDLAVAPDGRVDATFARGLVRKEAASGRFEVLPLEAGTTTGLAIAATPTGHESWVGTTSGLFVARGGRLVRTTIAGLTHAPIDTIAPDPPAGLLVVSSGDLLSVSPAYGSAKRIARVAPFFRGAAPWHVARARDGAVWVASIRGAVRIGRDGAVRVLDRTTGLPDESVDAVNPSTGGEVWITTDRGLVRCSAEGDVLRVYGFADGLPAREGIVRSACRDDGGRLWFGLVGAVIRYDPSADEDVPPPPRVHAEEVRLPDRARGESAVEVALSVVEYADPRAARVVWRLSPLETRWSRPSEERVVRWAALPPGDYVLDARAVDRTGRMGPAVTVPFTLPPLFHETGWAKALLVVLALALGASLPSLLRAAARVTGRLQEQLVYRVRELFAPPYRPIEDDPFAPGSPVPPLAQGEALAAVRSGIRAAFRRHGVFVLASPPGSGKTTLLTTFLVGGGGDGLAAVALPPRPDGGAPDLTAVTLALGRRGLVVPEVPDKPGSEAPPHARLSAIAATFSEAAEKADVDVLLLDDEPGPFDHATAAHRHALASALLSAAPRVSLLVARDVPPSIFAAEEPELARVARFVTLRPATPDEGGRWLSEVAGPRVRFAPGAAELASAEAGGDALALRRLGAELLCHLAGKRSNAAGRADVLSVLRTWDEAPPLFLSTTWVRLSPAERAVAAALGHVDRGAARLHSLPQVLDVLFVHKVRIGVAEVGAIAARLAEAGVLHRDGERLRFRSPVFARYVARHRPVAEEKTGAAGVLGPYELLEKVGSGGMGTVWRARRLDTREEVALKVIHPHLLATPEMRRRFLREGEIASGLHHPGIVRVLDRGEAGGQAYIAMEYLRGETLKGVLKRNGPLPPAVAARLVRDVAEAVSVIHAVGIVHRDLKTDNVVVTTAGHPKLLDFGLARAVEATRLTQSGYAAGTPDVMSPEQVRGEPTGPPTDVWALGIALYELLTGKLPFYRAEAAATFQAVLERPAAPPSELRPDVPEALEHVVLRCLKKRPEERWPSAAALRDALDVLLPSLPKATPDEVAGIFTSGISTQPMIRLPETTA